MDKFKKDLKSRMYFEKGGITSILDQINVSFCYFKKKTTGRVTITFKLTSLPDKRFAREEINLDIVELGVLRDVLQTAVKRGYRGIFLEKVSPVMRDWVIFASTPFFEKILKQVNRFLEAA